MTFGRLYNDLCENIPLELHLDMVRRITATRVALTALQDAAIALFGGGTLTASARALN